MRWGIFWKPLGHKLSHVKFIIDAAMRFHNCIVDYRMENRIDNKVELDEFELECINHIGTNANATTGTYGNNPNPNTRGRPSEDERVLRNLGVTKRQMICNLLHSEGMSRPQKNAWRQTLSNHMRCT